MAGNGAEENEYKAEHVAISYSQTGNALGTNNENKEAKPKKNSRKKVAATIAILIVLAACAFGIYNYFKIDTAGIAPRQAAVELLDYWEDNFGVDNGSCKGEGNLLVFETCTSIKVYEGAYGMTQQEQDTLNAFCNENKCTAVMLIYSKDNFWVGAYASSYNYNEMSNAEGNLLIERVKKLKTLSSLSDDELNELIDNFIEANTSTGQTVELKVDNETIIIDVNAEGLYQDGEFVSGKYDKDYWNYVACQWSFLFHTKIQVRYHVNGKTYKTTGNQTGAFFGDQN